MWSLRYFSSPDHPLQVAARYPVLLVEPVPVTRPVSLFEFVVSSIADGRLAVYGHPWDNVEMEVTGIVDGDAASLQPELIGIRIILFESPVDFVDVVFGLPLGIGVHHDLDVRVVLVVVVDRLDEGTESV